MFIGHTGDRRGENKPNTECGNVYRMDDFLMATAREGLKKDSINKRRKTSALCSAALAWIMSGTSCYKKTYLKQFRESEHWKLDIKELLLNFLHMIKA